MGNRRQGRILAFQALYCWDAAGPPAEQLLSFGWLDGEAGVCVPARAREFAELLIAGTIDNIESIDRHIREQLHHWDFGRLARVDLAILRVGVYALLYQPDIPASVTIDEAIDIAREYGAEESYRFVNGVLDGVRKGQSA
ncbi:MAG: transcription antitermination factor NusB [Spirochaetaceae bacterium]|nr:MAG: transcription antitermination factor NusB [Spirochaetaceae bacterium]